MLVQHCRAPFVACLASFAVSIRLGCGGDIHSFHLSSLQVSSRRNRVSLVAARQGSDDTDNRYHVYSPRRENACSLSNVLALLVLFLPCSLLCFFFFCLLFVSDKKESCTIQKTILKNCIANLFQHDTCAGCAAVLDASTARGESDLQPVLCGHHQRRFRYHLVHKINK